MDYLQNANPVSSLPNGSDPRGDRPGSNILHRLNARQRKGVVLLGILVSVSVVGTIALYNVQQDSLQPVTPTDATTALAQAAEYYCTSGGLAISCQNIKDSKITKYLLPKAVGTITAIAPSPDGSRYLIRTAPNPLYINDSGKLLLADDTLNIIQELPSTIGTAYTSFAWVDGNKTVATAKRDSTSGKTAIYFYDTTGKQETKIDAAGTSDSVTLRASSAGDYVFVQKTGRDKPDIKAINVQSRQLNDIATDGLLAQLTSYATVGYDYVGNTFYITGSGKDGKPALVIAKAKASGESTVKLVIAKTISDGYAYVPLVAADGGMFVSRQAEGTAASIQYGLITASGVFRATNIKPTIAVAYGTAHLPKATIQKNSALAASDYGYELTAAAGSDALKALVAGLVSQTSQPPCPAGRFNEVALLAQDATQAAIQFGSCQNDPLEVRYYSLQNSSYILLGQSYGTPNCRLVGSLALTNAVAPSCVAEL